VPRPLMVAYEEAHLSIGFLESCPLSLCQFRILKSDNNLIELSFQALQFCAEHVGPPSLHSASAAAVSRAARASATAGYAAYLARSSFLPIPRIPYFRPTFSKAAIAASR